MSLSELVVLLPLLGSISAAICIIFDANRKAELISTSLVTVSAIISVFLFLNLDNYNGNQVVYEWLKVGVNSSLNLSVKLDPLSSVMFLVVNIVSALVHIFSMEYMHSDKSRAKFFCYLSLFTFAMLILVCSDNFIQLFLGWEGVGVCSYLLVGFYNTKVSANNAAIKAFLVNRIGDFGYLISIALIYKYTNSINFNEVFSQSSILAKQSLDFLGFNFNLITIITMFLFMAAVGKSAQIGLHVWLPDAMEGPTPVSALIHAATMVTAGVFLVARCSPLFEYSNFTLTVITYVGLITSLFAASIALVQDDIKKIIAYSTCSQLGYMFFACGISAYSLGVFHLVTHAFFKALLFLGAGSVIHTVHHQQDIKKLGGLYRKLPLTYFFIIIGSLALAGIPPFAGYFSKDLILEYAFATHTFNGNMIYIFGCLGAFLTSVYSCRLIYFTFHKKTSLSSADFNSLKEPSITMIFPLFILAIGAIFSGYLFYDLVYDKEFWNGAIYFKKQVNFVEKAHHIDFIYKVIPIFLVVAASLIVFFSYAFIKNLSVRIYSSFGKAVNMMKNKWYVDELYSLVFIKTLIKTSSFFGNIIDKKIIDGMGPLGLSNNVWTLSSYFRQLQNGKIFSYAVIMFLGIIIFLGTLFFKINFL